jgi:hypothetical protein
VPLASTLTRRCDYCFERRSCCTLDIYAALTAGGSDFKKPPPPPVVSSGNGSGGFRLRQFAASCSGVVTLDAPPLAGARLLITITEQRDSLLATSPTPADAFFNERPPAAPLFTQPAARLLQSMRRSASYKDARPGRWW